MSLTLGNEAVAARAHTELAKAPGSRIGAPGCHPFGRVHLHLASGAVDVAARIRLVHLLQQHSIATQSTASSLNAR
jgi:hypothetical protein